jgi:hypothetical protein
LGTTFKAKGVHILFWEGWREGKASRVEEVVFVKKGGTFYGKVLGTPKGFIWWIGEWFVPSEKGWFGYSKA